MHVCKKNDAVHSWLLHIVGRSCLMFSLWWYPKSVQRWSEVMIHSASWSRELYSRLTGINNHHTERNDHVAITIWNDFCILAMDNDVFHTSFMDLSWAFIGNKNDRTIPVPSVEVRSDLQAVVHHQKHTSVVRRCRDAQSNSEHLWTPVTSIHWR